MKAERRPGGQGRPDDRSRKRAAVAGTVALIAVALIVWLVSDGDDSGPAEPASGSKSVEVVPQSGLLKALQGVGYPVYWAGPRSGVEYEVSRSAGRTYVRYLPRGEEAESQRPFLTVGSYLQRDALASIREQGQEPGTILARSASGGVAYAEGPDATNAYLAFPGIGVQIEVFDPAPGRALSLVRSGELVPVGGAG